MGCFIFGCDSQLFSNSLFPRNKPITNASTTNSREEEANSEQDSLFVEIKSKSEHSIFSRFYDIITTPVRSCI